MSDLFPSLGVLIIGGLALLGALRRVEASERSAVVLAFITHVVAAIAMVFIVRDYYGYGDMLGYHGRGMRLASLLATDFGRYGGEIVALILRQPNALDIIGNGRSTGSMAGIAGILCFLLDSSIFASCIALSLIAFSGKLALYFTLRPWFRPTFARRLVVSCLLLPSVVFWTAGILKESVAVAGLGWLTWSFFRWVARPRNISLLAVAIASATAVGLVKEYILFPFAIALVVGWQARRQVSSRGQVSFFQRPAYVVLAIGAAVVAVMLLGTLFPEYAADNLADAMATQRDAGIAHAGGSTYVTDSPGDGFRLSLLPLATVTALLRPFLFEVRNPFMLISALEMSFFLYLWWRALRAGPGRIVGTISRSWVLLFCASFFLLFAVAVGITSTNLGTLSRYRVPMMPFYAITLFAIGEWNARPGATRSRRSLPLRTPTYSANRPR